MAKIPKLPIQLTRKIQKTGQTRGADDDEIYQNRVGRNSTVLIPYHQWIIDKVLREKKDFFENGYIVLVPPSEYFEEPKKLDEYGLKLGENSLLFYETRKDYDSYSPNAHNLQYAKSRIAPLGGEFVARVPANTATDDDRSHKVCLGFTEKTLKGAGIRLYEYANKSTIESCRLQLEALFWMCIDSIEVASQNGMTTEDAICRKKAILQKAEEQDLLDMNKLFSMRMINKEGYTICPLCLKTLSANEFINKVAQPEGREVPDLTITQVNLFHVEELKYGAFNHRPYNLAWGHHFCNVVVKDSGIDETLAWMQKVISDNIEAGYLE